MQNIHMSALCGFRLTNRHVSDDVGQQLQNEAIVMAFRFNQACKSVASDVANISFNTYNAKLIQQMIMDGRKATCIANKRKRTAAQTTTGSISKRRKLSAQSI
eukprot:TRINITY_DN5377_c0_g1_i1.p1 TRINITY_DN5377_c0_g1~~TRINITY_DN5377_c0_g1_i1.p1  ORF type:complete len:103 (+),score=11.94 TRINITY_DN5377_c0_g1_i1:150-458(+)